MTDHETNIDPTTVTAGKSRVFSRPLQRGDQRTVFALVVSGLLAYLALVTGARWGGLPAIPCDQAPRLCAHFQVDINRASWPEIAGLPMIGECLARDIVAYRERHGPFSDVAGLAMIHGIGDITLERIAPHVALPRSRPEFDRIARTSYLNPR